jgi:hypothetical protein
MYGDVSYRDETYEEVTYGDVSSLYPLVSPRTILIQFRIVNKSSSASTVAQALL